MGKTKKKEKNTPIPLIGSLLGKERSESRSSQKTALLTTNLITPQPTQVLASSNTENNSIQSEKNDLETYSDETDYEFTAEERFLNKMKFSKNIAKEDELRNIKCRENFLEFENEENKFICKHCNNVITIANRSISNLKSHLGRVHGLEEFLTHGQKQQISKFKKESSVMKASFDHNVFFEKAIDAIIKDSLTFNIFNKPGLVDLLKFFIPDFSPPAKQTIVKRLENKYKKYMSDLKSYLAQIENIALTTDLWKNQKLEYFLTITAHFYTKNFEYQNLVLSFRKFKMAHTSENISMFIVDELKKLDILEKIVSITSDNEAAMVSACSRLSKNIIRISCMNHNLNLIVKNGLKLWVKKQRVNIIDEQQSDDESDNIDEDNVNGQNNLESNQENNETFEKDDSDDYDHDESDAEYDEYQDDIEDTYDETLLLLRANVLKIRKLINIIKKSNVINSYILMRCKDINIRLQFILDIEIRWNSTYLMLERFVIFKIIVDEITHNPQIIPGIKKNQEYKLRSLAFSNIDWNLINILIKILKPFYVATTMLEGRKYETISLSKGVEYILFEIFKQSTKASAAEKIISSEIKKYLEIYLKEKISKEQYIATTIAAYLDPSSHLVLEKDTKFIEDAEKEIKKLCPGTNSQRNDGDSNNDKKETIYNTMLCNFAKDFGILTDVEKLVKLKNIKDELVYFKSKLVQHQGWSFQQFWLKYGNVLPKLLSLAKKFNIICATSCPSEAAFSVAGYIQRKHRSRLSSKNLRFSIILKEASKIIALSSQE